MTFMFFSVCLILCVFFFFNDTATTEIYTLSLHDALPISRPGRRGRGRWWPGWRRTPGPRAGPACGPGWTPAGSAGGRPGPAGGPPSATQPGLLQGRAQAGQALVDLVLGDDQGRGQAQGGAGDRVDDQAPAEGGQGGLAGVGRRLRAEIEGEPQPGPPDLGPRQAVVRLVVAGPGPGGAAGEAAPELGQPVGEPGRDLVDVAAEQRLDYVKGG